MVGITHHLFSRLDFLVEELALYFNILELVAFRKIY